MTLEDGKYEFYVDEAGRFLCKRYGAPWREFIGDKAVYCLFARVLELEAEVQRLHEDAAGADL